MLPLLVLGSLFLKAVAQPVMAEHRFCADPARYQYRLTDMKNCYGQDMHYDYDNANCLVKESVYESGGDLAEETLYTYDDRHYLIKMEMREYPRGGGDPIVSYRHLYTRDDQGYNLSKTCTESISMMNNTNLYVLNMIFGMSKRMIGMKEKRASSPITRRDNSKR